MAETESTNPLPPVTPVLNYEAPSGGKSYAPFAITSFVVSLCSLVLIPCCMLGIVSIPISTVGLVFGILALRGMRRSGNTHLKGLGVAGLIIGIVSLVLSLAGTAFLLFAIFQTQPSAPVLIGPAPTTLPSPRR